MTSRAFTAFNITTFNTLVPILSLNFFWITRWPCSQSILLSHNNHLGARRNFLGVGGKTGWTAAGTVCWTDLALEAISPQSLGEYIAERQGWVGAVSCMPMCMCARACGEGEGELGCVWCTVWGDSVMQAFLSMHVDWGMCGSCGWLSPVSLPLKTLAKRNVFFTGFGCHMSGIMDRTAGRNMRRCMQPAAIDMQSSTLAHFVDCCHPNAGVRCR